MILRGMTWSHPRGYDPMLACAAQWQAQTGVEITWDKRSLQDFESFPVKRLAQAYDLIVVDHPHVGQVVAEGCLAPLDQSAHAKAAAQIAASSLGASFASYTMAGHQWALPIDAAAQVQAWRPDCRAGPVADWWAVMQAASEGLVTLPLRPPHNLMCLITFAANLGTLPGPEGSRDFIEPAAGCASYERLASLAALVDPAHYGWDPIASLEALSEEGGRFALMPYGYGYASYALAGFRPHRLAFGDIPVMQAGDAPRGSALGGTGIAVSAFCEHREAATEFAYWLASGPVQAGLYAASGGQPVHREAWRDSTVDARFGGFFSGTERTLDTASVRPRHDGYMTFQQEGSEIINDGLRQSRAPADVIAALNARYAASL